MCNAGNRWIQPLWIAGGPVHLLAYVCDPPQSPPRRHVSTQERILVTDNSWTPEEQDGFVHGASH